MLPHASLAPKLSISKLNRGGRSIGSTSGPCAGSIPAAGTRQLIAATFRRRFSHHMDIAVPGWAGLDLFQRDASI
jgi:hypothetical protein